MFNTRKILAGALLVAAASGGAALVTTATASAAPSDSQAAAVHADGAHEPLPLTREGLVNPAGTRIWALPDGTRIGGF